MDYTINSRELYVALDKRRGRLIMGHDLWSFFSQYNKAEEAFTAFINDNFVWRAPNADMVKFKYDPFSGEKIDWEMIKTINKGHLI